jgi:hypothetical protein
LYNMFFCPEKMNTHIIKILSEYSLKKIK